MYRYIMKICCEYYYFYDYDYDYDYYFFYIFAPILG